MFWWNLKNAVVGRFSIAGLVFPKIKKKWFSIWTLHMMSNLLSNAMNRAILFTCAAMQHCQIDVGSARCQRLSCLARSSVNCRSTISEFLHTLCHKLDLWPPVHKIATKLNNHTSNIVEYFYHRACQNSGRLIALFPLTFYWFYLFTSWMNFTL